MKRISLFLLTAIMLLSLCACGKKTDKPAPTDIPKAAETSPEAEAPSAAVYDDSRISEQLSLAGEYDDDAGNHVTYSYHVPELESESADAKAINAEINEKFGAYVNDEMVAIGSQSSIVCTDISYQSFWHGSTICLVVTAETDWDFNDYGVYSFDFETERAVTNAELAKLAGITEEELLQKAAAAAAAAFDSAAEGMPEDDFYSQQREWTLSDENINSGMMLYLNDDGNVTLILPIGSLAGSDWYYHVLELEK